jgi:ppGpp synthetase/RelA/SpoT-type nucleotidyltranferase
VDEKQEDAVRRSLSERQRDLESELAILVAFLDLLCKELRPRDQKFHYRWIEQRIKDAGGAIRALKGKDLPADRLWSDVDDLLGARVIVVTKRSATKLANEILSHPRSPILHARFEDLYSEDSGYRANPHQGAMSR